jgi:ADP-ribose pyrophosphatase
MVSNKSRLSHWARENEEIIFATPVYTAYRERYSHPDLAQGPINFYTIQNRDGVNVIACDTASIHDKNAQILWVKQFRPAVKKVTLELPGGTIEDSIPDILENAQRELLEETSCVAKTWIYLGITQSNAGLLRSHLHTYLALETRSNGAPPSGDGREVFEVEWRPFSSRYQGVISGDAIHSSTLKALALLEAHMAEKTPESQRI